MQLLLLYFLIFISLTSTATSAVIYAKPGCKDMCGSVRIPYPFGVGKDCRLNDWYNVDCNSSRPYLSSLKNLEVLSITLKNRTVTVRVSMISDCENPVQKSSQILSVELEGSPFFFSRKHNKFVVEGCGEAHIMFQGNLVTGCSTKCQKTSSIRRNNCTGISCCETRIPYTIQTYSVNISRLRSLQGGSDADAACGSAFVVDENFNSESDVIVNNSFIPVSLLWTLTDEEIFKTGCSSLSREYDLDLGNGTTLETHACDCLTWYEGNPYLSDGCQVVEECAVCRAEGKGYCGYDSSWNLTCVPYPSYVGRSKVTLGVILGVSISMGVLILSAIVLALHKVIRETKDRRRRARFFKRNGGLLLNQQESTDKSLVDKTIHFTAKELNKATNNFNENRILGRGAQGIVYKGMLTDGRIVAVKRSKLVDESQLQQFINEVVVLSQVNHRNIVKLLGCCLETEVPLLVSEFISNGTLYASIHTESDEFPLTLNTRMCIATEVAGALSYLHSSTSIPIYHRDIKSTNILLDDKYRAKVSDFGTSRFVSIDQTHLTTLVKGTFGYLDPEYFQTSQFTEKSDVYSFGVVLVELLTSEKPISLTRFGEHRSLATHFMLAMEEGQVMSVIDARIIKEGSRDALMAVANLAMQCLNTNGKNRPTMKEVACELESIMTTQTSFTIQPTFREFKHKGKEESEELILLSYDASTSI